MRRILVVEDDETLADGLVYRLKQEGFEAEAVYDGRQALEKFSAGQWDMVILDLMLPGMYGLDVLRAIRRKGDTPVIILTAKDEVTDRVAGIAAGADDYIIKPFHVSELLARIRMVLRRVSKQQEAEQDEVRRIRVGEIEIDPVARTVRVKGRPVDLRRREFDLLLFLARNCGWVFSREALLEHVWGEHEYIDEHTVDVHVSWLRRKIEADPRHPRYLVTVRGVGYKLESGQDG